MSNLTKDERRCFRCGRSHPETFACTSDSLTSKTVTEIAWRIVNSAKDTCAAANSVLVHRQLIGELREALQSPDETTVRRMTRAEADAMERAFWRSVEIVDELSENGLGEP